MITNKQKYNKKYGFAKQYWLGLQAYLSGCLIRYIIAESELERVTRSRLEVLLQERKLVAVVLEEK